MKKYIILFFVATGLFLSCDIQLDETFDQSASERIEEQVTRSYDILTSAPNGWVMEYYPHQNQNYGGVNILVKFNKDNTVVMSSETAEKVTDTKTSSYVINRSQAAVLAFDTYNEYISYYADPSLKEGGGVRYGYMGDLDFAIMEATDTEIVLKGTKTDNKILMKPIPANVSWAEYLTAIQTVRTEKYDSYMIKFILHYKEYTLELTDDSDYPLLSYPYTDDEGLEKTHVTSYMYTDTGIKFYEPMEVFGLKIQNFRWDKTTLRMNCTDAGAEELYLQGAMGEYFRPYEYYLGEWKFYCTGTGSVSGGHSITITEQEYGKTLTITGITYTSGSNVYSYPITLSWRRDGRVEIKANQIVGQRTVSGVVYDMYVRICSSSSWYNSTGAAAMISKTELHENPNRVDFESNGVWASTEGFGYYYHTPTSNTTCGKFLMPLHMIKQ